MPTTRMFDTSAGYITFGPRRIHDMHRYQALSFMDVIVKSSNVGAIKIGLRVGAERMGQYIRRFGFGHFKRLLLCPNGHLKNMEIPIGPVDHDNIGIGHHGNSWRRGRSAGSNQQETNIRHGYSGPEQLAQHRSIVT